MAEAQKDLITGAHRPRLWGSGIQGQEGAGPRPASQDGDRRVKYDTECSSYVSKVMS